MLCSCYWKLRIWHAMILDLGTQMSSAFSKHWTEHNLLLVFSMHLNFEKWVSHWFACSHFFVPNLSSFSIWKIHTRWSPFLIRKIRTTCPATGGWLCFWCAKLFCNCLWISCLYSLLIRRIDHCFFVAVVFFTETLQWSLEREREREAKL